MLYTIPDYYRQFHCVAGACEDTCCAGWQIVADKSALRQYKKVTGEYRKEIRAGVDWKEGAFRQDEEKRCYFLNEDNLCNMYTALGKKALCKTCKRYPRHIEEFEGVREMTLSVSCPEVAKILLQRKEPVQFLIHEDEKEECWDDAFDPFLYSLLADARTMMIQILQNRELSLNLRTGLVLAIAHDLQIRIQKQEIFDGEMVLEKYRTEKAMDYIKGQIAKLYTEEEKHRFYEFMTETFRDQYRLERLRDNWEPHLLEAEQWLYGKGEAHYYELRNAFEGWMAEKMPKFEIQKEQLLVYFLSTYLCGAVYDGHAYSKAQMAVVSVLLMQEILMAQWIKNEKERMSMKKLSIFMAALFVFMLFAGIRPAYAAQYNLDFEETAESVYMVNLDTDTVVFEKNADERRSPASITKIMTMALALEMCQYLCDGAVLYLERV